MFKRKGQYVSKSALIPERVGQRTDVQYPTTEAMAMGKLHKDIGHLIVQSAEDAERSDSQVIKVRIYPHVCIQATAVRNVALIT